MNKIKKIITKAPSTCGVYIFVGAKGEILYVGKAKDIKKRLKQHLLDKTEPRKALIFSKIQNIQWLTTPTKKGQDALFGSHDCQKVHPDLIFIIQHN